MRGVNITEMGVNITEISIEHGEPLILHVIIDKNLNHFVVCYGYADKHFVIGDPSRGIVNYSAAELEEIWVSKKCLTLKPNGQFQQKTEVVNRKKEWIKRLIAEDFGILGISVVLGAVIAVLGMVMSVFSQKLIDNILPSKDFPC